jgi:hypothetical protein
MSDEPRDPFDKPEKPDATTAASVEFIGPFEEHRVVVDGWQVPFLTATPFKGGMVALTLDHRFDLDVSVADAERIVPWVADVIAVAMGYACFPRAYMGDDAINRKPPFSRLIGIGSVKTEEAPDA